MERMLERPNNGFTELEHHGRSQLQQIGLNPYDNEPRSNQPNLGHKEGQTTKTGEQLMQMALEPRKQQDKSQKQPSTTVVENITDSLSGYRKQREEV